MTLVRGRYNLNYSKGNEGNERNCEDGDIISYCEYIVRLEFRERW